MKKMMKKKTAKRVELKNTDNCKQKPYYEPFLSLYFVVNKRMSWISRIRIYTFGTLPNPLGHLCDPAISIQTPIPA